VGGGGWGVGWWSRRRVCRIIGLWPWAYGERWHNTVWLLSWVRDGVVKGVGGGRGKTGRREELGGRGAGSVGYRGGGGGWVGSDRGGRLVCG